MGQVAAEEGGQRPLRAAGGHCCPLLRQTTRFLSELFPVSWAMGTKGTGQEMKATRLWAIALFDRGLTGREVAKRVEIDQSTPWVWRKAWRERGLEGIT